MVRFFPLPLPMSRITLHYIKVRLAVLLGRAIDIHSKSSWPGNALSNFYPHGFEFDGVKCGSIEGFLQAIKTNNVSRQVLVCALSRNDAKARSTNTWKKEQNLYWQGRTYNRHGYRFQFLLRRAFRAMLKQCPEFRRALLATGSKSLYHTIGRSNPRDTVLTEKELCAILTELRNECFNAGPSSCSSR